MHWELWDDDDLSTVFSRKIATAQLSLRKNSKRALKDWVWLISCCWEPWKIDAAVRAFGQDSGMWLNICFCSQQDTVTQIQIFDQQPWNWKCSSRASDSPSWVVRVLLRAQQHRQLRRKQVRPTGMPSELGAVQFLYEKCKKLQLQLSKERH